jgi:thiol-disulfide isomerase/thioredoxin
MTDDTLDPRETPEPTDAGLGPETDQPIGDAAGPPSQPEPAAAGPSAAPGAGTITMPKWVPAAIVIALFVGVGLGLVIGLLLGGDGDPAVAAPPETTITTSVTATTDASSVPESTPPVTLDPDVLAYGAVTVTGDPLPAMQSGAEDQSAGLAIPGLAGIDGDGADVSFAADGRAKIILFVAHWCPHCQEEIPVVRDWLAGDPLTEDIDLYAVATFTDPTRPNFPPTTWLEQENWAAPVILDDENSTAARSFGITAVPAWVFVWEDGTVAFRGTGKPDAAALDSVVTSLLEGPAPPSDGGES